MPESRSKCPWTYKIHRHQAQYQRLNANTLYVVAILFSWPSLHREALPCLPNNRDWKWRFHTSSLCCARNQRYRPRSHYDKIGDNDKIDIIFSVIFIVMPLSFSRRCRVIGAHDCDCNSSYDSDKAIASSQICMLESQDNQVSNKNDLTGLLRD